MFFHSFICRLQRIYIESYHMVFAMTSMEARGVKRLSLLSSLLTLLANTSPIQQFQVVLFLVREILIDLCDVTFLTDLVFSPKQFNSKVINKHNIIIEQQQVSLINVMPTRTCFTGHLWYDTPSNGPRYSCLGRIPKTESQVGAKTFAQLFQSYGLPHGYCTPLSMVLENKSSF